LISTRLTRTLAAAALGAIAAAPAALGETLHCDIDTYEGMNAHLRRLNQAEDYESSHGPLGYGTPEVHELVREAIAALELDPERTPIVHAALDTGEIQVVYCPDRVCSIEDEWRAHAYCALALQSRRCVTYAIRVEGDLYCTARPAPPPLQLDGGIR
jgi:hypothetical protein